MKRAFVLSGGGSLGAVQVGMLATLFERGIVPDFVVGTSAGAFNAAYIATHGPTGEAVERLADIWRRLERRDVFPFEPFRQVRALSGGGLSLCGDRGLRALIERHVPVTQMERTVVPLHVVATSLLSGEEVLLSSGDLTSALLASAAIPGILPPVERDGLVLVDGGVADHAALSQAIALGAEEIYVLPAGFACALQDAPQSALAIAVQALTLLIQQRLVMEAHHLAGSVDLKVLPPLCPLAVSSSDFGHARELISRATAASARWIDSGGTDLPGPARFLSLHDHRESTVPETMEAHAE
jgi:NTE family protein